MVTCPWEASTEFVLAYVDSLEKWISGPLDKFRRYRIDQTKILAAKDHMPLGLTLLKADADLLENIAVHLRKTLYKLQEEEGRLPV